MPKKGKGYMTRQWLADPSKMCDIHLRAEHAASHQFFDWMEAGNALGDHVDRGMFFGAEYIKARHDLLAPLVNGHGSPLDISPQMKETYPLVMPNQEDIFASISDLFADCPTCANLHLSPSI